MLSVENSKAKDPNISMHRFPAGEMKRKRWIEIMGLAEGKVKQHSRICSRHFRNSDPANGPEKTLGKKFASPKKLWSRRAERAQQRDVIRSLTDRLKYLLKLHRICKFSHLLGATINITTQASS